MDSDARFFAAAKSAPPQKPAPRASSAARRCSKVARFFASASAEMVGGGAGDGVAALGRLAAGAGVVDTVLADAGGAEAAPETRSTPDLLLASRPSPSLHFGSATGGVGFDSGAVAP